STHPRKPVSKPIRDSVFQEAARQSHIQRLQKPRPQIERPHACRLFLVAIVYGPFCTPPLLKRPLEPLASTIRRQSDRLLFLSEEDEPTPSAASPLSQDGCRTFRGRDDPIHVQLCTAAVLAYCRPHNKSHRSDQVVVSRNQRIELRPTQCDSHSISFRC